MTKKVARKVQRYFLDSWLLRCSLRSHRTVSPTPKNGEAHFSAMPIHRPNISERDNEYLITQSIKSLVNMNECSELIERIKQMQIKYFKKILSKENSDSTVDENYGCFLKLIDQISEETGLILSADDNIDKKHFKPKPIIIIAQHFGIGKTTKISELDLKECINECSDTEVSNMPNAEPFPFRYVAIFKLIEKYFGYDKYRVFPVQMNYPFPFSQIQEKSNFISINNLTDNQYKILENEICLTLNQKPNHSHPIFVIFPEGGTSGKKSGGVNPYHLENFRCGFIFLSIKFKLPIFPVIQAIDRKMKIYAKILNPISPYENISNEDISVLGKEIRDNMQKQLNNLVCTTLN